MSAATTVRTRDGRQPLQLSIDPSPYRPQRRQNANAASPDSISSSPSSSARRSFGTTSRTTPTSGDLDWVLDPVLCLYDFDSSDRDHLSFTKNEILDIVKREDSGWWAAVRPDGNRVGWIPKSFVQSISVPMAERLRTVQKNLRVFEYEAYQLSEFTSAQGAQHHYNLPPTQRKPHSKAETSNDFNVSKPTSPHSLRSPQRNNDPYHHKPVDEDADIQPPPSPITPVPLPPGASFHFNKPVPPLPDPTPTLSTFLPGDIIRTKPSVQTQFQKENGKIQRRRPMIVDDRDSLSRLSTLFDDPNASKLPSMSPDTPEHELDLEDDDEDSTLNESFEDLNTQQQPKSAVKSRAEKIRQLTGSEDALAFHNAVQYQASLPWYLRPAYSPEQIQLDSEGRVRAGTLRALVERLAADSLNIASDTLFKQAFFMTFRTFATASEVFDLLIERYQMDHPADLNNAQFEEWKERKLRPTQGRVLAAITMWLEDHRLLEEEPHIARRLSEFLSLVLSPAPLALTAKLMIQNLERLTFSLTPSPSPVVSPRRRRRSKAHKNDLLRLDPNNMAEQLSLYEHKLYAKISPQECLNWAKVQSGKSVANLWAFCATYDKLASWVKISILETETVSRRAGIIDHWIKTAEKCRNLNNFASMSAIVTAITSSAIGRLHLSWTHVSKRSNLEALTALNDPSNNYQTLRTLLAQIDSAPCVPFLGPHLTELIHTQEAYADLLPPSVNHPNEPLINFVKRMRWFEVVSGMLKFQGRTYAIAEGEGSRLYVLGRLQAAVMRDQSWFWTKSQEVHQTELANADIRKGLEAAGF